MAILSTLESTIDEAIRCTVLHAPEFNLFYHIQND